MRENDPADFWEDRALQWDTMEPPLRPCPKDTAIMRRLVDEWYGSAGNRSPRVLILGVTPEIATMPWPGGTRLLAVDSSPGMIRHVWPGRSWPNAAVVQGNWLAMPVRSGSSDVVIGDGFLSNMSYPEGYRAVKEELRRVVRPDGILALRLFGRRDPSEWPAEVVESMRAGLIGSFSAFRLRLMISVQKDLASGVKLADVWEAWHEGVQEPETVARAFGWPPGAVKIMERYRGVQVAVTYPTVEELADVFSPEFSLAGCFYPEYELGDYHPTLLFRPM